jgi:hypothetical protein
MVLIPNTVIRKETLTFIGPVLCGSFQPLFYDERSTRDDAPTTTLRSTHVYDIIKWITTTRNIVDFYLTHQSNIMHDNYYISEYGVGRHSTIQVNCRLIIDNIYQTLV